MEIIIGKSAGFCGGIIAAVTRAKKELESTSKLYCLGELTHNKEVLNELESKGLVTIENIKEAKGKVLFRAHGITKEIYEEAKKLNLEVIDCTCKKVLKIHDIATEYQNNGYYIILIGEKVHPEVIGTFSFCGDYKSKISDISDIDVALEDIKKSKLDKVLIIAQTTFNSRKFDEITEIIKDKLNSNITLEIRKTICDATETRQKETKELASSVDFMIIIGGKKSSNTNKLYEISKEYCKNTVMVETYALLDRDYIRKFNKIGIMAGASTPKKSIDDVINYLNNKI